MKQLTEHVAVIIVNYKIADLCCRALGSVANERQFLPNMKAVIVDNDSGDGSAEKIEAYINDNGFGEWAELVKSDVNGGFAYGNNTGIKRYEERWAHKADFYWFLNPDTCLREEAGYHLLNFVKEHPKTIAGSRLEDEDGTWQVAAFNFPTWKSETLTGFNLGILDKIFSKHRVRIDMVDEAQPVDWVAGASLMFPASVLEEVGLMDQVYFLYYEETDYCLQIQRAGYQCWYVPQSRIIHEVGASTGVTDMKQAVLPRRPKYWFESRRRYFGKNFGFIGHFLADVGFALGYSIWYLRKWLTHRDDLKSQPPHFLRDFIANSGMNPFRQK